jgi:hypothetical protein
MGDTPMPPAEEGLCTPGGSQDNQGLLRTGMARARLRAIGGAGRGWPSELMDFVRRTEGRWELRVWGLDCGR